MSTDGSIEAREQILQFREAWREFETTLDESAVVDLLAEDFVWLPSWDDDPEIGKEEMIEHLKGASGDYHTVESNHLTVRDDWALDQIEIHGAIVDQETGEAEEITIGANEVYQRKENDEWKHIISLPYLPYRSVDKV